MAASRRAAHRSGAVENDDHPVTLRAQVVRRHAGVELETEGEALSGTDARRQHGRGDLPRIGLAGRDEARPDGRRKDIGAVPFVAADLLVEFDRHLDPHPGHEVRHPLREDVRALLIEKAHDAPFGPVLLVDRSRLLPPAHLRVDPARPDLQPHVGDRRVVGSGKM